MRHVSPSAVPPATAWLRGLRRGLLVGLLPAALLSLGLGAPRPAPAGVAADARPPAGPAAQPGACEPRPVTPIGTGFLTDISEESGIQVDNFVPDPDRKIPINDHSRLGFADLNGDGLDDIVAHSLFPNSQARYTDPDPPMPFEHLVFLNEGEGRFRPFHDESGLRFVQSAFFAFGDVDNDGDQDAFAGLDIPDHFDGESSNQILLNDGEGRFTRKPNSGVELPYGQTVAANAVFADFDGDAVLDLFVGNGGTSAAAADLLYLGNGDGSFRDASTRLEGNERRPSNGSVACDYDEDGDLDIFVSNYGISWELGHNVLWENDGEGRFRDVAPARGFHALATGNYWLDETGEGRDAQPDAGADEWVGGNGFGLDCADITGDGLLDIYLTTISHPDAPDFPRTWSDPTQLLVNQGPEAGYSFRNDFLDAGLPFNEGDVDGAAVDLDNDGRLDLSTSRDKKYESRYTTREQKAWFGLYHQGEDGRFASLGYESGVNQPEDPRWQRMKNAQNHAWSDIDRDGDADLLVGGRDTGGGRPNFLFRNEIGAENDWIGIELVGDGEAVNRDAIGARLVISAGQRVILREVKASRGMYNSMDMRHAPIGIGDLPCDYGLEVRWPDGDVERFAGEEVGRNRWVRLTRGEGLEVLPDPGAPPTATPTASPTSEPTTTPTPAPAYLPAAMDGVLGGGEG